MISMKMSAEILTLFTKENIVLCQCETLFIEQKIELGMALEKKKVESDGTFTANI